MMSQIENLCMTDGSAGNRKGMQQENRPTVWASQFLLICPFLFFEEEMFV